MQDVEVLDLSSPRNARSAGLGAHPEPRLPARALSHDLPDPRVGLQAPWVSAAPATPAATLAIMLRERDADHVMVLEHGALIGVLCSCDLHDARPRDPIFTLMSRRVITVDWRASLWTAARVMFRTGVGFLPVTDRGVAIGAIDRRTLAEAGFAFDLTGPLCTCCGGHRHVARRGCPAGLQLCLDCCDRARGSAACEMDEGG